MKALTKLGWRSRERKETKEIVDVLRVFTDPEDADILLVKNYLRALRETMENSPDTHVPHIGTFSWVCREYRMPDGKHIPAKILTFRRCGRFKHRG